MPWLTAALRQHDDAEAEATLEDGKDNTAFAVNFENAKRYEEQFSLAERLVFERILDRAAWLLRDRLLPHLWRGETPVVERQPAFRTHMVLQALILRGALALEASLADPASVVHAFKTPSADDEKAAVLRRHLALLTLIRPRHVTYTVRVFRWNTVGGGALSSKRLPSVLEYSAVMATIVPPHEHWRPKFKPDADGYPVVAPWFPVEGESSASPLDVENTEG